MDQTYSLLQAIVENGRTGADACGQLLSKTEDMNLRDELMAQRQQYEQHARDAEHAIAQMGQTPHPKGMAARCGMWMGMQMNTLIDKTSTHAAQMLIEGATMGVIELTKAQNSFPDASAQAHDLAAALIAHQQRAIDRLKPFLLQKHISRQ